MRPCQSPANLPYSHLSRFINPSTVVQFTDAFPASPVSLTVSTSHSLDAEELVNSFMTSSVAI